MELQSNLFWSNSCHCDELPSSRSILFFPRIHFRSFLKEEARSLISRHISRQLFSEHRVEGVYGRYETKKVMFIA